MATTEWHPSPTQQSTDPTPHQCHTTFHHSLGAPHEDADAQRSGTTYTLWTSTRNPICHTDSKPRSRHHPMACTSTHHTRQTNSHTRLPHWTYTWPNNPVSILLQHCCQRLDQHSSRSLRTHHQPWDDTSQSHHPQLCTDNQHSNQRQYDTSGSTHGDESTHWHQQHWRALLPLVRVLRVTWATRSLIHNTLCDSLWLHPIPSFIFDVLSHLDIWLEHHWSLFFSFWFPYDFMTYDSSPFYPHLVGPHSGIEKEKGASVSLHSSKALLKLGLNEWLLCSTEIARSNNLVVKSDTHLSHDLIRHVDLNRRHFGSTFAQILLWPTHPTHNTRVHSHSPPSPPSPLLTTVALPINFLSSPFG